MFPKGEQDGAGSWKKEEEEHRWKKEKEPRMLLELETHPMDQD